MRNMSKCDDDMFNDIGYEKATYVRQLHEQVRSNIEKKLTHYASQANKGRKKVTFEPGDWVWVHLRKERFPLQRKSKLHPRGDGPFQVLEKFGDNAYKIDLPGKYNVSSTFNVSDLSPFDIGDALDHSGSNAFQEGGNDEDQGEHKEDNVLDKMEGPMTRARAKKIKQVMEEEVKQHLYINHVIENNKLYNVFGYTFDET